MISVVHTIVLVDLGLKEVGFLVLVIINNFNNYINILTKMFILLDIDECALNSTLCGDENCSNYLGGYACTPCPSGYRIENSRCVGN